MYSFNEKNINNPETFVELLQNRTALTPDKAAFTFLNSLQNEIFTYQQLESKIRNLAGYLQSLNIQGKRILLLYPPGIDYIIGYFACLYAGVIAVPVYPPDSSSLKRTLPRLNAIIKDSNAQHALSTGAIVDDLNNWENSLKSEIENENNISNNKSTLNEFSDIFNLKWIAADRINENYLDLWNYPKLHSNSIAYLQYTSGSTGSPKGVIITHENLLHNTNMIFNGFGMGSGDYEGVIWLPIYHDMGLVGGILEPIFAGFHCTLLSPVDFLKRPLRWLQIISDITDIDVVSGGPNFAYELCLRATNQNKREKLDLSNWKVAFSGAEPVRASTINEFSKAFEVSGFKKNAFYPCYGLAEGTLFVTGAERDKEPVEILIDKEELKNNNIVETKSKDGNEISFVSSGRSILDCNVKIVNPNTKTICKDYEIGEIWSSSKSNADGYWNKPNATKETFNAFIKDSEEGPYLRTGDLGFMKNGEVFVTGRLKDLIIIRGSNHYPQDIEATVEKSHPLLRQGNVAAFSVDINNEEQLVIVQEARAKKNVNWEEVIHLIKTAVIEEHNIQPFAIVLVEPKTIFKTSSGKIQRFASKEAFKNSTLKVVHEWRSEYGNEITSETNNEQNSGIEENLEITKIDKSFIQNFLVNKLAKELKTSPEKINKDLSFTDFGLDSAKSILLVGELEDIVGKSLEPTILWNYPSINKLVDFLTQEKQPENKEKRNIETEEVISNIEDLSDEEVEKILLKKLGSEDHEI